MVLKSVSGEELARKLISMLFVNNGISSQLLLAAMKDQTAVNEAAVRILKIYYPNLLSIGCISHTVAQVAEHVNTSDFITSWISLFSHGPKTRFLWLKQTGKSMATYSTTHWRSPWEVIEQMSIQFGDVLPFLQRDNLASNQQLQSYFFY